MNTDDAGRLTPEQLNGFIDGELAAADAQAAQEHLEGCHGCALRALAAMQVKRATARAAERFAASPDVLARLEAGLRPQTVETPKPKARVLPFRAAAFSAIAAALVLAVSLVGWRGVRQSNELTAELLDQHLATLSSGVAPEVLSSDKHTVKPWFQGRLPFSFNLPEANALPADTVLRGADLVYLDGRPAALLTFTIHKHEASVFVTQRSGILAVPPRSARSGFAVRSATTGELRLMGVSDVNPAELEALVNVLAKVQ
jgi:anti-sigma factor RsiW